MRVPITLVLATLCSSIATLTACGGDLSAGDRDASSEEGAAAALDAGIDADAQPAPSTCAATPPPSADAGDDGAIVCTFPSGRVCAGRSDAGSIACECDDRCNFCACAPGNVIGSTDGSCGSGDGGTCTGPVSAQCTRGAIGTPCGRPLPRLAYCPPWVQAQCGSEVCPDSRCRIYKRDKEGGSVWCCPP